MIQLYEISGPLLIKRVKAEHLDEVEVNNFWVSQATTAAVILFFLARRRRRRRRQRRRSTLELFSLGLIKSLKRASSSCSSPLVGCLLFVCSCSQMPADVNEGIGSRLNLHGRLGPNTNRSVTTSSTVHLPFGIRYQKDVVKLTI